jgi:hypothetical protein
VELRPSQKSEQLNHLRKNDRRTDGKQTDPDSVGEKNQIPRRGVCKGKKDKGDLAAEQLIINDRQVLDGGGPIEVVESTVNAEAERRYYGFFLVPKNAS